MATVLQLPYSVPPFEVLLLALGKVAGRLKGPKCSLVPAIVDDGNNHVDEKWGDGWKMIKKEKALDGKKHVHGDE